SLPALPSVKVVRVETAQEMLEAVAGEPADVAILAAAVADFRPQASARSKIPREDRPSSIELEETPDVLASVMARHDRPFVVGFAAETGAVERAVEKAKRKGVDLMVYNDVTEPGSGFGSDTNRVVVIDSQGETESWPMMSKAAVAERLIERIFAELATLE
ncbi:MAG TPA: bifunctional phosphopantothenoylcysteine decarboxylase/phosphopantothenate--cysteine ligase CoaBC, partial [Acidimicrobiia bacterium]|nr:bifunctional phosphopantothenoylcysteine decarboxylase/phosphopantothenate--cysteine ligase CoaBC [Acidimicrobiia bacterium]